MKKFFWVIFPIILSCTAAFAQSKGPWLAGIKLGVAQDKPNEKSAVGYWSFAPALAVGYQSRSGLFTIMTGVQHNRRYVEGPSQTFPISHHLNYLTFPVHFKTGLPSTRLHFLLGGMYATCLDHPKIYPPASNYDWHFYRHEFGPSAGIEAKIINKERVGISIGAIGSWAFIPMFKTDNPRFRDAIFNRQIAISLNAYFHDLN